MAMTVVVIKLGLRKVPGQSMRQVMPKLAKASSLREAAGAAPRPRTPGGGGSGAAVAPQAVAAPVRRRALITTSGALSSVSRSSARLRGSRACAPAVHGRRGFPCRALTSTGDSLNTGVIHAHGGNTGDLPLQVRGSLRPVAVSPLQFAAS